MTASMIVAGLACGLLLVSGGAVLMDCRWHVSGLPRASHLLSWLSGLALVAAVTLTWRQNDGLASLATRLLLAAAVAAPALSSHASGSPAARVMPSATALVLAGAGLIWLWAPVGTRTATPLPVPPPLRGAVAASAATICAGLGIRSKGEALADMIDPSAARGRLPCAVYAPLALLVGGVALASLWFQGTISTGTRAEIGLASAFLAWSGVWLSPQRHRRAYALLIVTAALLLLWVALTLV